MTRSSQPRKRLMEKPRLNLVGRKYGRLTVAEWLGIRKHRSIWRCECECGGERITTTDLLQSKHTFSCGCLQNIGNRRTHGMSHGPEHRIWCGINARCYNSKRECWKDYGGRGITVCAAWRKSFAKFYADMGPRPPSMEIDRIDNDGPYSKANCRWATAKEQARNRRHNLYIKIGGITRCASEWAEIAGHTNIKLIPHRFHKGWRGKKLLMAPRGYATTGN